MSDDWCVKAAYRMKLLREKRKKPAHAGRDSAACTHTHTHTHMHA